ncbi:MAG TPA: DUF2169 domain-containing protein [Deltaproteobacteria bacterium]|nr:DUF2169 domain-containing protein [Deltaproteobacteria bacterium]HQI81133.1 DUF2169 domain-containing protein [Deltaproteobacteria bacterium]
MPVQTTPSKTLMQFSGRDPEGRSILSVLLKITYAIMPDGRCEPSPGQVPLVTAPEPHSEIKGLLVRDIDIFPFKPATDIVIKGHAYGKGRTIFEAGVRVHRNEKRILVIGNRRCTLRRGRGVAFSDPEPVDTVPLRYTHAYGGRDRAAEEKYGNPFMELHPNVDKRYCDMDMASPFLYPRNPCGRGYLIEPEREAVEAVELPNLEDPQDPLIPERLAVLDHQQWIRMPLPQATDWYDYGWFPRISYSGIVPYFEPQDAVPAEVRRGLAPEWITAEHLPDARGAFLMTNGASPGLTVPYLRGGEEVLLGNMHPRLETLRIKLPPKAPRLWTDGRKGRMNPTEPVMHTVLIEPDEDRLSILWRGSAPALRPYLPDELAAMPLRAEWP